MGPHPRARRAAGAAAALAVTAGLLAGVVACGDAYGSYCGAVTAHQQDLGQALSGGPSQGFLSALPMLQDLQGKAPADVRGDWDQVVSAVQGLKAALQAAGVDPATYDKSHPPVGVSAAQRARISAAATALGSQATLTSWDAVQQEVRDVCHTQLFVGA